MKNKKKREFSKVLLICISFICVLWISATYVLAAFDKQPAESVTCAIVGAWLGSVVMYLFKAMNENKEKIKKGNLKTEDESNVD